MGCKKAIIRTAKEAWAILGPELFNRIASLVALFDEERIAELLAGKDRRSLVIKLVKEQAEEEGREYAEWAMRMAIEHALRQLREGATPSELSDDSDEPQPVQV